MRCSKPVIALRLPSTRPADRVAELESFGRLAPGAPPAHVLKVVFVIEWVLGEVLQDDEHSIFILDTAASSESQVRKAFEKVDSEALYLEGVHIVLVASITKEEETVSKIFPWTLMLDDSASYLFVRNWVTEVEPRAVPIVEGESFVIEQGHYGPPELLEFIYET